MTEYGLKKKKFFINNGMRGKKIEKLDEKFSFFSL